LRTRAAPPHSGAVVRDFKDHAFPMAEEKWSVAVATGIKRRGGREHKTDF